jgi:hypothetical protein
MARHSPAATAYVMVAVPAGTRRRRASSSGAAGRCWSPRCGRSGHPGADRRAGFGRPIIVKIGWPHREMYGEPAALRWWGGHGAVRLFAHDPQRHALLLERCEPGDQLATSAGPAEDALGAGCAVLRQLWELPPPMSGAFEDLAAVTGNGRGWSTSGWPGSSPVTTRVWSPKGRGCCASFPARPHVGCCCTVTSIRATCCPAAVDDGPRSTQTHDR